MSKSKIVWVCKECGNEYMKYQGRCFYCGTFDSLEESTKFTGKDDSKSSKTIKSELKKSTPITMVEDGIIEKGFSSGIGEFDRVCGGKITEGSVAVLGGDPGAGKSTLLTNVCHNISLTDEILYVSGEESEFQVKNRLSKRMKLDLNDNFHVMFTNDIDSIEEEALNIKPKFMVIDSLNTIGSRSIKSDPGDISQMRHTITRVVNLAKENDITIFMIVQVTKDGEIAGPKKVEHMVDTVLYLEGEKYNELRTCTVEKNRFGERVVACFKMTSTCLEEIPDPSEYLLKDRITGESGSAVVCINETRPLLIEVQALTAAPQYENASARRTSEGFPRNRLNILLAVLEKRGGKKYLSMKDVFVNVVGGFNLKSPDTDLGVAAAIYSAEEGVAIPSDTVLIGEVGLIGEVRPVANIEQIVKECERVGFKCCVVPEGDYAAARDVANKIELIPVKTIRECFDRLFK